MQGIKRGVLVPNSVQFSNFLRRFIDFATALVGLALLLPFFALIGLWIKLDSPGPIFYRAKRAGKGGENFGLYKFRSMVVDADKNGPAITSAKDNRITPSGHFLRNTKLDELPQLLNVLLGDMSLVGSRPEDPRYVELYSEEQRQILEDRPGITGAASLEFRHEAEMLTGPNWEEVYRKQVMPSKLAIDLAYMENRSLMSDGLLILRTIFSMFLSSEQQPDTKAPSTTQSLNVLKTQ